MKYLIAFSILISLFVLMGVVIIVVAKKRDTKRPRDRSGLQRSLRRRRFGRRYRGRNAESDEYDGEDAHHEGDT